MINLFSRIIHTIFLSRLLRHDCAPEGDGKPEFSGTASGGKGVLVDLYDSLKNHFIRNRIVIENLEALE